MLNVHYSPVQDDTDAQDRYEGANAENPFGVYSDRYSTIRRHWGRVREPK